MITWKTTKQHHWWCHEPHKYCIYAPIERTGWKHKAHHQRTARTLLLWLQNWQIYNWWHIQQVTNLEKKTYDKYLNQKRAASEFGIPAKFIRPCKLKLGNNKSFPRVVQYQTSFQTGESLSCDFFNLLPAQIKWNIKFFNVFFFLRQLQILIISQKISRRIFYSKTSIVSGFSA